MDEDRLTEGGKGGVAAAVLVGSVGAVAPAVTQQVPVQTLPGAAGQLLGAARR